MHAILLALILLGQPAAGELTIRTGDLESTMTSQTAWTITSVRYAAAQVVLPMGGQGAVLAVPGGSWFGSAMKADSEKVASLTVTADDQPVALALPQTVSGRKVTVTKTSTLAALKHRAETTFDNDGLLQRHTFEVTDDITLSSFYAFLYSFWPEAKQWLAQPLTGERLRGAFNGDKQHKPRCPVRWLAQYDPAMQKGVVVYFREPYISRHASHSLWDTTGYHKLFAQPVQGELAKGTQFDLTMVMRFFSAPPTEWEKKAQAVIETIQQQTPPVAPPETPPAPVVKRYGPDVPEQGLLTLKTSKYTVPMCAQQAWTIQRIEYDGHTLAHERGFYGTVLVPQGGQWWGTGHTEGGPEIVHALQLTADGKPHPIKAGETVAGHTLALGKDSTIWKFKCRAEVTVTDELILERTQLEATEDVDLKLLYYFMHCFVPTTTKWLAELPSGELAQGELLSDGGFQVNRDTRWVAQFEPQWQMGLLCYAPKVISGPGGASKIWNLERYHKFYCQANGQRSFKQGERLDYSLVVQAVPRETGDWAATKAAAARLKKLYPPQ